MDYPDRKTTRPGTTRRVRMDGHVYSHPGYYFITICSYERQHLFGQITGEEIDLTPSGQMIHQVILTAESKFDSVSIDAFVVMPDHVHILLGLSIREMDEPDVDTLGDVVQWFKNSTIRRYSIGVARQGWGRYREHLWQKGYHDHIVRNERELETLRRYIATNVESWGEDTFY